MKIIQLGYVKDPITGGEQYNAQFVDILSGYLDAEVIRNEFEAREYKSWRKPYIAFNELKWLKFCHKGDILLFPDTSYGRLLILSLLSRFKKGCRSIVIIHHFTYLNESGFRRIAEYLKQHIYYALIKEIVTPNIFTLDFARKLYPHKKIAVVPLPFELDYSQTDKYIDGEYLFVGTIERRKGLSLLLDALGIIRKESSLNFNLDIVGKIIDEAYYASLVQKAKELGIEDNVHFHGRVSRIELEEMYSKTEIFTFPSLLEGFGMVIVEAMSHGIPVIAFDNSAMPYTIKNGINGLLASNKDPISMAEQIIKLSGNKKLRQKLQTGMKETIENLCTFEDFKKAIKSNLITE